MQNKIVANKLLRKNRIPFDFTHDPFYNDTNIHYLEKITTEIDSGNAQLTEHTLEELVNEVK